LSVELIVDCDSTIDPDNLHADCGIYGGWPYLAFEFVQKIGGLPTEASYPYCSGLDEACFPCQAPGYNKTRCGPPVPYCKETDSCQAKLDTSDFLPNLKVVDWKKISEDENEIAASLQQLGPLSVALDASELQFYGNGVFNPIFCSSEDLNHAVLLVGWGVEKGLLKSTEYWTVKNRFGRLCIRIWQDIFTEGTKKRGLYFYALKKYIDNPFLSFFFFLFSSF
jgi:cathepsin F